MDWAKAKTILIIVLLVLCLCLGGILYYRNYQENQEALSNVNACNEYLKSQGIKNNVEIPMVRPEMEVLFVEYSSANAGQPELSYNDYKVFTNRESSAGYTITGAGESKAQIVSASSAIIEAVTRNGAKEQEILDVELCYYINDDRQVEDGNMDTAVPAWRITTSLGTTYILAY